MFLAATAWARQPVHRRIELHHLRRDSDDECLFAATAAARAGISEATKALLAKEKTFIGIHFASGMEGLQAPPRGGGDRYPYTPFCDTGDRVPFGSGKFGPT